MRGEFLKELKPLTRRDEPTAHVTFSLWANTSRIEAFLTVKRKRQTRYQPP